jgi:hypothetical protein
MEKLTFEGLLSLHTWGEASDVLFLSSLREPLAEELGDTIRNKNVTARYWITDKQATYEEALEDFVKMVSGCSETRFGSRYSELTGYLWTDEECKVGGHDLIDEFKSNVGKWLILEIEIHSKARP